MLLPKYDNLEYWKRQIEGIEKAAIEFGKFGVVLDYFFYNFNTTSFKKYLKKVMNFDCDGLLFAPIFYKESVHFLNEYKKKDIPVVMVDTNIISNQEYTYIGQDAFQSGYLAGRLISLAVKDENNVLILKITSEIDSSSAYLERIDGFYSFFRKHDKFTNFNFSEVTIKDSGINELNTAFFLGIDSVYVPNSRAYIVARFLKENNIKGICIIGYDLSKENVEYLNQDTIDFLINQRPEEQGYLGINYLYKKIILKEPIKNTHHIPLEIILKENYSEV